MKSSTSHKIKQRETPKDVFITPKELAKSHIDMIQTNDNEIWLDPCRFNENGSYYSQFHNNKDWCEISEDKDFLSYTQKIDVICGNPPYSMLDKWFKKSIELNPRVISYLIGINNLTTRRMEEFEKAGYGLNQMKMLKVYQWYGMSVLCVWEKGTEQIMKYDRKIWRSEIEKKKYYQNNKEQISEKKADKTTCECGCLVTRAYISRHIKTKKHINLLQALQAQ